MEFEELRKIWDAQNNQPLYAINEKAMYNLILSKKKQAHHITNISELLIHHRLYHYRELCSWNESF
jgi:hypothetical protein